MCARGEKVNDGRGQKVNLTTFGKKRKDRAKRKGKIPIQPDTNKELKCFFYKKKGHMKKDCSKLKIRLDKKGTQFSFVSYESIWLMLIITYGGLIMILQFMFQIPYRVCKT